MTRRRKYELLIGDLRRVLVDPEYDDRYGAIFSLTYDLYCFLEELSLNIEKAQMLIDITRIAREATGPGRDTAEEKLMEHLDHVVRDCSRVFDDADFEQFLEYPSCEECPMDLNSPCTIMHEICAYALDCFQYTRPRDQFAGMRRARAFQILGSAGRVFDIPGAITLALGALKRNRKGEARGAICFLEDYFKAREGMPVADDIVAGLLSVVERTDNRSNATGALNVLVEAETISEFEALDRISEWKDKHYR